MLVTQALGVGADSTETSMLVDGASNYAGGWAASTGEYAAL